MKIDNNKKNNLMVIKPPGFKNCSIVISYWSKTKKCPIHYMAHISRHITVSCQNFLTIHKIMAKLDGHGRDRREAARRLKSECKINFRKTKFFSQ